MLHHTEYDTRLASYAVILDAEDRVLLALWNEAEQPRWTLPGGGVELSETVEEAAVREVHEETGYDVDLGRLLGVDTLVITPDERTTDRDRFYKGVRVIFEATVVGGNLRNEVHGSTDEARWFPLSEVPDLVRVELVDVGLRLRAAG